jgi:hypothetical protein
MLLCAVSGVLLLAALIHLTGCLVGLWRRWVRLHIWEILLYDHVSTSYCWLEIRLLGRSKQVSSLPANVAETEANRFCSVGENGIKLYSNFVFLFQSATIGNLFAPAN